MKDKRVGKSIISGALSLTVSALIVKIIGLIYKVPLSYILSDEGMGYFNSAYTVYTFFYIVCTAGVPKSVSIITSAAESEGRGAFGYRAYKVALKSFFIIGGVLTCVFFLTAGPISVFIGSKGAYFSMLAIAPSIVFVCASGVLRGYFNGKLRLVPIAVCELISGVAKLSLGLAFALIADRCGLDVSLVSAVATLGISIGSLLGLIYLLKYAKKLNFNEKAEQKSVNINCERRVIRRVIAIAAPITLTSLAGSLGTVIDLGVIMKRLLHFGYTELQASIIYGNYTTLAIPMLNLVATLVAPISAIILPLVSKSTIRGDKSELSEKISLSLRIACLVAIPSSVALAFKGEGILKFIFEDSSAVLAVPLLQLLAPGIVFMCIAMVLNTALEGMGKSAVPLVSLIIASAVKLAVSYYLIGNEDFGILGAPIGTTLSYFVSFMISVIYAHSFMKLSLDIVGAIVPPLIISLVAALVSRLIFPVSSSFSVPIFFLELAVFGIAYLAFMVFYQFCYAKIRGKHEIMHKNLAK